MSLTLTKTVEIQTIPYDCSGCGTAFAVEKYRGQVFCPKCKKPQKKSVAAVTGTIRKGSTAEKMSQIRKFYGQSQRAIAKEIDAEAPMKIADPYISMIEKNTKGKMPEETWKYLERWVKRTWKAEMAEDS